jgi:hypothetical protein
MNAIRFVVLAFALVGCSAPAALPSAPTSSTPAAPVVADAGAPPAPASDARPGVYDGGGPAQWSDDAGWLEPVYDVAKSEDIHAKAAIVVACNEGDTVLPASSGCTVNGGELLVSEQLGHAWACLGVPAPAKSAMVIVWVQCHRGGSR